MQNDELPKIMIVKPAKNTQVKKPQTRQEKQKSIHEQLIASIDHFQDIIK